MNSRASRYVSLDVMRGLVVMLMIVVNASMTGAVLNRFDIFPALAHADWIGFTIADWVFPAFIVMVGISIPFALHRTTGLDRNTVRKIAWRSLCLFLVGIFVSEYIHTWMTGWLLQGFRPMGVLQRIAICYCASALLYLGTNARTRMALASAILILYWPLTLLPMPGGPATDLHIAGANFVSWVDRAVLGTWMFVDGPLGFDPEGLLSTLPAMAQCLLGVSVGEWFLRNHAIEAARRRLALGGLLFALAGYLWSYSFPVIKSIWTSSFVLLSTGLTMMLFAVCSWIFDQENRAESSTGFCSMFGRNAIFAYVLHIVGLPVLGFAAAASVKNAFLTFLLARLASLGAACVYLLLISLPLFFVRWRKWTIRV